LFRPVTNRPHIFSSGSKREGCGAIKRRCAEAFQPERFCAVSLKCSTHWQTTLIEKSNTQRTNMLPHSVPTDSGSRAVRWLGVGLAVFAFSLIPGCGPQIAEMNGKVYYKDKVVTSGFVTMVGKDGLPKNSPISEDGTYRIGPIATGELKIVVTSPSLDSSKGGRKAPDRVNPETGKPAASRPEDAGPSFTEIQKKTWRELPPQYGDMAKTTLKFTAVSGPNDYDIKLD
jgi:hypothetical protein